MSRLERFLGLPQPDFEFGETNVFDEVRRRAIKGIGKIEVINGLFAPFLSPEVKKIRSRIQEVAEQADEFSQPAWKLLQGNIIYLPISLFVRASPFYSDNWLLDTFMGTLFLDLPDLEFRLLNQFTSPDIQPQLPTTRLFPGNRFWAFDDESTMLGLIWRADLWQRGISLGFKESEDWAERWQWIRRHVQEGFYGTPPGIRYSRPDVFRFHKADVITYNQGIYAVAALSARKMELEEDQLVEEEAIQAYQSLASSPRRLKFSRNLPYTDGSVLFGEFLALHLFGRLLLSDETVERSMALMSRLNGQIPVVLKNDRSYLSPSEFNRPYQPGDYQNRAEWPVWSAIAQATSELHGGRHDRPFWQDLFYRLQRGNHPEYFYTGLRDVLHNRSRENHLWNTAVYLAARKVMNLEEREQLV